MWPRKSVGPACPESSSDSFYVEKCHRPHTKRKGDRHIQLVACKTTVQRSVWTVPIETSSKPRGTFVDAALPPDETGQRFGVRLVLRGVPQHARPFAFGSLVDFPT